MWYNKQLQTNHMHMDEQEIVVADVIETPEVVVEDPATENICVSCE